MPAFKEHTKLVDPSDLVVGRQYFIKELQNDIEYKLVLCSVELDALNRKLFRGQFGRIHCTVFIDGIHIYDLDDVMEEEKA